MSDSEEEAETRVWNERVWHECHYDELTELYDVFSGAGQQLFGSNFSSAINFADFVAFVRSNMLASYAPKNLSAGCKVCPALRSQS